jgi:hypothetical protein
MKASTKACKTGKKFDLSSRTRINKEKIQHLAKTKIIITQKIIKKLITPEVALRGGNNFTQFSCFFTMFATIYTFCS